jgi:AcrR family transcriptional regulator
MSLREQKKTKTRNAILEAAIALFNENGYDNTSIEQIAKAAGVGKGTVYSYYQTKKDIIKGFCEYEFDQIHNELVAGSNQNTPVLDQMVIIYMTEFNHITGNPEFGRLYMRESVFPDDCDVDRNLEIEDKYFSILFPILEEGQRRGELRKDLELLHITGHFYGLFILIISAWYTGRIPTEEVEMAMRTIFHQALEGLQPRSNNSNRARENNE